MRRFLTVLAAAAIFAGPAFATFPGGNGKIAFVSKRDGNADVFVMNADGSAQTNLTQSPSDDEEPVWSPDGTRIAFDCDHDICVMNGDGTGRVQLTESNPSTSASSATWSPDGRRIAYIQGSEARFDLYLMNADGSEAQWLATGPTILDHGRHFSFFGWRPTWSPDGTRIAFDDVDGIGTVAADGTDRRRVAKQLGSAAATWSPDGKRIAFTSANWTAISVVNANGSGLRTLGAGAYPSWSPDGTRIAFAAPAPDGGGSAIWTMDPTGKKRVQLTTSGQDTEPNWQPLPGRAKAKPPACKPSPARRCPR